MDLELSIYELSALLKNIENSYKLDLVIKNTLSGGWMTITGEATIETEATEFGGCKPQNILTLRVNSDENTGSLIKLTGNKTKLFKVNIASTRFKELSPSALTINKIKINKSECKLRIDEDIIFTIKASEEELKNLISN